MTQSIACNLLNIALTKDTAAPRLNKLEKSIVASSWQWQSVPMDLALNGISPLVANRLNSRTSDRIPPSCWEKMQASYRQSRMLNTLLFLTVYRIVKALTDANLHPVVGTNVVLADSCYQDPGERPLKHIDLLLSIEELPEAQAVLKSLGFNLVAQPVGSHKLYLTNSFGVICQIQGLKAKDLHDATVKIQPQHIQLPEITVLEPNAMLVELAAKLSDRQATISLKSVADLALFLQKWGDLLEPHRLERLMPQSNSWQGLWRAIRYLDRWGQPTPLWLSQGARNANPIQHLACIPHSFTSSTPSRSRKRLVLHGRDLVQMGK